MTILLIHFTNLVFFPTINKPTRIQNNCMSLIDNIFTNTNNEYDQNDIGEGRGSGRGGSSGRVGSILPTQATKSVFHATINGYSSYYSCNHMVTNRSTAVTIFISLNRGVTKRIRYYSTAVTIFISLNHRARKNSLLFCGFNR